MTVGGALVVRGVLTGPGGLAGGLNPSGGGIQISTGGLLQGALKGVAKAADIWVVSGTTSLVKALAKALAATSVPSLGTAFRNELGVLERLGAELALLFLVLATIQAIVRQDLGTLLRTVLLRLPVAVLLGALAAELVVAGLKATDEMCSALMGAAGSPVQALVQHLATLLSGTGQAPISDTGFAGLLVAFIAAVVSLVLWVELVVRSAAVVVGTLFLPLALAGILWQPTAHWARRLGETLAGLVLAKLVVVAVLVLAVGTLGEATGINGLVEAVALLALAAGSPFALLRLVPMVEAGAIGHLEGIGHRGFSRAGAATGAVAGLAETFAARARERADGLHVADDIPMASGTPWNDPVVLAEAARLDSGRQVGGEGTGRGDE